MSTFSSLPLYLYQVIWTGVDWLFPPICAGCGTAGSRWCAVCQNKVEQVPSPVCAICGCGGQEEKLCKACSEKKPTYDGLRSWALYEEPLRQAVHQLKYHRDLTLGEILSRPLERVLRKTGWDIDWIIPVPLSPQRARQRGYNQSTFLAFPLALAMGLSIRPDGLFRVRETVAQVGLPAAQRRINVKNAFKAEPGIVAGKRILLIDDVTTTGATMEACSNALKTAGAEAVYGLTLARSNWPDQAG